MKRQKMLGGVIMGAGSALIANALLFSSLFTEGRTETTMLLLAGLALVLSIASVGLTAMIRPNAGSLLTPSTRHLSNVA